MCLPACLPAGRPCLPTVFSCPELSRWGVQVVVCTVCPFFCARDFVCVCVLCPRFSSAPAHAALFVLSFFASLSGIRNPYPGFRGPSCSSPVQNFPLGKRKHGQPKCQRILLTSFDPRRTASSSRCIRIARWVTLPVACRIKPIVYFCC